VRAGAWRPDANHPMESAALRPGGGRCRRPHRPPVPWRAGRAGHPPSGKVCATNGGGRGDGHGVGASARGARCAADDRVRPAAGHRGAVEPADHVQPPEGPAARRPAGNQRTGGRGRGRAGPDPARPCVPGHGRRDRGVAGRLGVRGPDPVHPRGLRLGRRRAVRGTGHRAQRQGGDAAGPGRGPHRGPGPGRGTGLRPARAPAHGGAGSGGTGLRSARGRPHSGADCGGTGLRAGI